MFNSSVPYSVPVAPISGNNGGLGGFGDSWIGLIIILALLFGNGNGFGGLGFGGGNGGYSEVQRGFDQNAVINKLDGLTYGLSDSTYALSGAINTGFSGVQQTLCQGFNGVDRAIADCCCKTQAELGDIKYQMASQACDTRHAISDSTRDIIENQNANSRQLLDFLVNDKLATLQAENQSLRLSASQAEQNAFIRATIDASTAEVIRRTGNECPIPAYVVNGPTPINFPTNACGQFAGFGYGSGYGSGCGCA